MVGGIEMKYLVVSDSHGDREILKELVKRYQGKVDYFFHCGDSELSANDCLWDIMMGIQGNCDYEKMVRERSFNTGLDTIYLVHGDNLVSTGNLLKLELQAEANRANIALFGHTHVPYANYDADKKILVVNPGSISHPRQASGVQTYALIESTETFYQVTFYDRSGEEIETVEFDGIER